uniref:Mediator complex subunit 15 n=1 Tax=Parastrongyloides trichosuri TaxID=131310 RepID=A0A0N4Z9Z6_PARTI
MNFENNQANLPQRYVMQNVSSRMPGMSQQPQQINVPPNQQRPQGQIMSNQSQMVGQPVMSNNGQRQNIQMAPQNYYMQMQQNEQIQLGNQERRQVPVSYERTQGMIRSRMGANSTSQMLQQQQQQQMRMRQGMNSGINQPHILYVPQGPGSVPTQMTNNPQTGNIQQIQRIPSTHLSGSPMPMSHSVPPQQTNYSSNAQNNLNPSPPRGPVANVMYNNANTSGPSPQFNSALQAELRGVPNMQGYPQQHKLPPQAVITNPGQVSSHPNVQQLQQQQPHIDPDRDTPEYTNCLNYIKQYDRQLQTLVERLRMDGGNEQLLNNIEKIQAIIDGKKVVTLQFLGKLKKTVEGLIEKFDICKNMYKSSSMVLEEANQYKSITIPHYDLFHDLKSVLTKLPDEVLNIQPDNDPTPYYLREKKKNDASKIEVDINKEDEIIDDNLKFTYDENGDLRLIITCNNGRTLVLSNKASKELKKLKKFKLHNDMQPISDHTTDIAFEIFSKTPGIPPFILNVPINYPESPCSIHVSNEIKYDDNQFIYQCYQNLILKVSQNDSSISIRKYYKLWEEVCERCLTTSWGRVR